MATLSAQGLVTGPVQTFAGTTRDGKPYTRRHLSLFTGRDVLEISVPDEQIAFASGLQGSRVNLAVEVSSYNNFPQYRLVGLWDENLIDTIAGAIASTTDGQRKAS